MASISQELGEGRLSRLFLDRRCRTLADVSAYLAALPYGRPRSKRPEGVVIDGRGTCSSKHALFVLACREVGVPARLMIGFFEMNGANVPGTSAVLREAGLAGILEAHCFVQLMDGRLDLTGLPGGAEPIEFSEVAEIEPHGLDRKIQLHRGALAIWAVTKHIGLSTDALWDVRERCIAALTNASQARGGRNISNR